MLTLIAPVTSGGGRIVNEHRFRDRRPEIYGVLALNRYLWNPVNFFSLYGHRVLPNGAEVTLAAVQYRPVEANPEVNVDRLRPMLERVLAARSL